MINDIIISLNFLIKFISLFKNINLDTCWVIVLPPSLMDPLRKLIKNALDKPLKSIPL